MSVLVFTKLMASNRVLAFLSGLESWLCVCVWVWVCVCVCVCVCGVCVQRRYDRHGVARTTYSEIVCCDCHL